ncbi:hypothetical protein [Rhodovulum sulfidophilum]|uniref:Uncharacterized protein n=1 Tax=Rhodovulum sulfidophilum TaxID=35806 RepID=A0ABS1RX60_RHOSU|nr:hypothetical protein [Rhodovulum sulfidophilum]MBL3610631.1 hypothetical protein [Rhodovulum sulfidophilum]MCE8456272.1 hypothetical protein [Rhodovulum sulfidophilum]
MPKKIEKDAAADEALTKIRKRLNKALVGFSSDFPADLNPWDMESSRPAAELFPVPELVLFAFRNILGWRWSGVGEKVRWTVYGSVLGEPVGFELRKFGFTILRAKDSKLPYDRIVGQVGAAMRQIEDLLAPFAIEQTRSGNVLIVNRFGEFESRYRYFRDKAHKAFAKADKPAEIPKPKGKKKKKGEPEFPVGMIAAMLNHQHAAQTEGYYLTTAMIEAFFSALEHRLILLLAFRGLQLNPGGLEDFLKKSWDEKLKTVLPLTDNHQAGVTLGKLRRIKERLRNPFSHGGVENDGGSLFFHLPGIGAVPANFSNFANSPRFSFVPIKVDNFDECCSVFDSVHDMLSTGPLAFPHRFVDAGVDPSFDAETLSEYAGVMAKGADAVEQWIERWGHMWTTHANMDY